MRSVRSGVDVANADAKIALRVVKNPQIYKLTGNGAFHPLAKPLCLFIGLRSTNIDTNPADGTVTTEVSLGEAREGSGLYIAPCCNCIVEHKSANVTYRRVGREDLHIASDVAELLARSDDRRIHG